jgi:hypothetical protein
MLPADINGNHGLWMAIVIVVEQIYRYIDLALLVYSRTHNTCLASNMKNDTDTVAMRNEQRAARTIWDEKGTFEDDKNKIHQFMIQLSHKKSIYLRREYRYNKKRRNLTKTPFRSALHSPPKVPIEYNNFVTNSSKFAKVHAVRPLDQILTHRYFRLLPLCTRFPHNTEFE